jgi:mannose-6-phosphate isomerase
VRTEKRDANETVYLTPAAEFVLSVIDLRAGERFRSVLERNVEILLCTDGRPTIQELTPGAGRLSIDRGESVLVPAAASAYELNGPGIIYRATVP